MKNVQKASALVFMEIYIINGFENEAENGKQISQIQHKQTQGKTQTQIY